MNTDKLEGSLKEATGKWEETVGILLLDKQLHLNGIMKQQEGKAQQNKADYLWQDFE